MSTYAGILSESKHHYCISEPRPICGACTSRCPQASPILPLPFACPPAAPTQCCQCLSKSLFFLSSQWMTSQKQMVSNLARQGNVKMRPSRVVWLQSLLPACSWTGSILISCTFSLIGLALPKRGSSTDLLHCINVFIAWHQHTYAHYFPTWISNKPFAQMSLLTLKCLKVKLNYERQALGIEAQSSWERLPESSVSTCCGWYLY